MDKKEGKQARTLTVDDSHVGQRVDNYLISCLKGLPKSRIYKALRKGEVRINKKRIKPEYRLKIDDQIRIPPLRLGQSSYQPAPSRKMADCIEQHIIVEDSDFIILNKPAGMAVHGGSGISLGVIEALRHIRPKQKFLELVHRLDRETSGCLLIAKKSSLLKEVHTLLHNREVLKTYILLVMGKCQFNEKEIAAPLKKNILKSGERIVVVSPEGKSANTVFHCIKRFNEMTLLQATPVTGRTHQIRVHASYMGHPILGDEKYGNSEANKYLKSLGLKQLCLHSQSIAFYLASKKIPIGVCARLLEPWSGLISESERKRKISSDNTSI